MKNSVLVSVLAIASVCAAQFDAEQCGPQAGNQKCAQNKCCSQYGWCGTSNAYCQASRGCQASFGRCSGVVSTPISSPSSSAVRSSSAVASPSTVRSSSAVASPSALAALISTTGRCGSAFGGQTCKGSTFGDCCSIYNWCGKTTNHCKASLGCQPGWGVCTGVSSSSISLPLSSSSSQRSSSSSASSASQSSSTSISLSSSSSSAQTSASSLSSSYAASSSPSPSISSSSSSTSSSPSSTIISSSAISSFSAAVSSSSVVTSSSSVVTSSSSVVASSSSVVASSSSVVASSSSIVASSLSSSLIPSTTAAQASPSPSLVTPTNNLTPTPSPSGSATVITRVLHAAQDPSVDRTASEHLVPKNAVSFFFAEDGTSYTTSVQTNLDSGAKGILLENIASINSVTCSGSTINLQFSDEASSNIARGWPAGTILFTLSAGCNTATERGVYRLGAATATSAAPLQPRATSPAQNNNYYQLPLDVLLIEMAAVVSQYDQLKKAAAEAAAADTTSIPTPPGSIISTQSTSTTSGIAVSSSTITQPSASASASATALPACGGYAPGGRFNIGGTTYQISCTLAGTWRERWLDITYVSSFTECIASCNLSSACVVSTWVETQTRDGKTMCLRWGALPYKYDNAADAPMAVKVVASSTVPSTLVTSATATPSS